MAALKAVSELNRLRIMRLLLKNELGVNDIAHELNISQYNVSKHLRILREAGLLEMRKQGQQRLYYLADACKARMARNQNVLRLDCCAFDFDKLPH